MKTPKIKTYEGPLYKIRIDYRTIITVRSKEAIKMWKQKYPQAVEVV